MPVLKEHLRNLKVEWESGKIEPWKTQWERETELEPAQRHGLAPVHFHQIAELIGDVIGQTRSWRIIVTRLIV